MGCSADARSTAGATDTPHYQVHVVTSDDTAFRLAVNVQSQESPSELLYLVDENLQHPLTAMLSGSADGFGELESAPEDRTSITSARTSSITRTCGPFRRT